MKSLTMCILFTVICPLYVYANRINLNFIQNEAFYDEASEVTTSVTRVRIRRPLEELKKVTDPRSWAYCSPQNFKETILIEPPARFDDYYHRHLPNQLPLGGTGWSGMLYEKVSFSMGIIGDTTMFNYIEYKVSEKFKSNPIFRHDFKLVRSLEGVFTNWFGMQVNTGYHLVVDDGYGELSTTNTPGVYELLIVKKIKYASVNGRSARTINRAVKLDLEPFMTESLQNFLTCDHPILYR